VIIAGVCFKLADGLNEFETYIGNNREFIPNFGERPRQGKPISTAFVESPVNRLVRQFVKKRQMQQKMGRPARPWLQFYR
jgi:hypothetical protein